jgi:hypothetical protein
MSAPVNLEVWQFYLIVGLTGVVAYIGGYFLGRLSVRRDRQETR